MYKGSHPKKKSVFFCFFSKGGVVMSETKLFEEFLCLEIFQEEGGGCLIPKFLRNFSAYVWKFLRRGGGST